MGARRELGESAASPAPIVKNQSQNLLRARFKGRRLPQVEAFTASLPFDRRLYRHDIRGSIAHARMLAKVKLLTTAEVKAIERGLQEIQTEIEQNRFIFELADEDIHLAIERRLTEKIGAAGQKLHTARSRNDQVVLDLRMFLHDEIADVVRSIGRLHESLLGIAERHVETIIPGYTHLQRAQPVTLAHHLMAYIAMLERDVERFAQAGDRCDVMPLGAGALAGTTLPIDRELVARELGFSRITENSIDAVSDRDFALDFLSASAILAVHLSRMAEEIILWSTAEFGFVELPDEFATGSSMMPQKKNPDLLELIRGKSGRVIGSLMALLTTMKGLPLAYNSDMQEDKERVFDALDTIKPALNVLAQLWRRIEFKTEVMAAAAGGFALATDLAEYLVERGVPFRESHEIVGSLVRDHAAKKVGFSDLTLDDLRRYSAVFQKDALGRLSPEESVRLRTTAGGPAPAQVRQQLRRLRKMKGAQR
jgi:argininosuccinate lyase